MARVLDQSKCEPQKESTLLTIIAQVIVRGASFEDIKPYYDRLILDSSKTLVKQMFFDPDNSPFIKAVRTWTKK